MINGSDHWAFNIFTVVEFCFYFLLFHWMLKNRTASRAAFYSALFFPLAVTANCIFTQTFNQLATYAIILGSLLVITFACMYFYQLLRNPNEIRLLAVPFFWISTGLLFYNAGDFVNMAIFPYLAYANDESFANVFYAIEYNLNTLLYCCFIIAFLCQRKTTNISI